MGRKKREYSYDDWKKAMDLHNIYKFGYRRIARILNISENTVKGWLYYGRMPPETKWKAESCIELGYALGTIQGDGSVCKSKLLKNKPWYEYRIELATIDPEFAITFSRGMAKLLNRKYIEPWWNKKRSEWEVEYRSRAFYIWYKRTEKQGLEGFKPYIEHDIETVRYYLRGIYDSDGTNDRNKIIRLDNTNKELLEYVQYLLKEYFNIKATGPYLRVKAGSTIIINGIKSRHNYNCYWIQIGRKEHVKKFLKEIGFSIVRKQLGLRKHEKVFVEGIGYVEPYELVELGLFKLPFNQ